MFTYSRLLEELVAPISDNMTRYLVLLGIAIFFLAIHIYTYHLKLKLEAEKEKDEHEDRQDK